ncbi:DNA primase [Spirochaetia bacterium 38H-sp]|uniref:DNA primase n=1 Tax=Rarispira pelagica TaxID=3141764 RepID=A0ABU9UAQ8_9SPIR
MGVSKEIINQIKDRIDIVEIVGEYTQLSQKGRRYFGICPFHSDTDPSFSVDRENGLFYCFGCHKGGDVFAFLMEAERISFNEALTILAEKASIQIRNVSDAYERNIEKSLEDFNTRTAKLFNYFLINGISGAEKALEYYQSRNLTTDMINKFMLGYCPSKKGWLFNFLLKKGFQKDFLKKCGLFSSKAPDYCLFSDRLVFPIFNTRGIVIGFGGRRLSDNSKFPKYINSPETGIFKKKNSLYGLYQSIDEIKKTNSVVIVEGYFDVIALHQANVKNVVAPLGTAFTIEQANILKRYASDFFFLFDSDSAGLEATYKAGIIAEKIGVNPYCISLPLGEDPASVLEKKGGDSLYSCVIEHFEKKIDVFKYILEKYSKNTILSIRDTKEAVIKKMFGYISSIKSSVRREEFFELLSNVIKIPITVLKDDFYKNFINNDIKSFSSINSYLKFKNSKEKDEMFMMRALCSHPVYFKEIRKFINIDDLVSDWGRRLFILFEESYRTGDMKMEQIIDAIEDSDMKNFILDSIFSEEFDTNTKKIIMDTAKKIKINSLQESIAELTQKLNMEKDDENLKKLLEEQMHLQEELRKLRGKSDGR